ncbi:ATP-binding protein [Lentzea sp. NPDC060358]|uniref:ATP-binding protein n=1 Tax=Lentzea sp. NPDC060358 TaxID=3347103 RepID=UPI0036602A6A
MRDKNGRSPFGELLLRYRRDAGLSQDRLAQLSGISVRALRELEQGRARAAQRRSAEVLADALALDESDRTEFLLVAERGRRRRPAVAGGGLAALPPLPTDRVGRADELAKLRLLLQANQSVAIVGQPGLGKTVLASSAAHDLRDEFPDGCLSIDLRGVDEEPLPVRAVFERLLSALGVSSQDIPASEAEQASRYRALLAKRRVLVLLDNAASEAQVRPLLATAPGCRTLVTCRRTLVGLEGVRWMHLAPFGAADSEALLRAIVGEDRVRAEPREVRELIALCGNLPLALRIAGNRLASRPHWSLGHLVEQLHDESTRLSSLSAGDLQVRSAFEVSYRMLSGDGRMLFRRLAAVPSMDFGVEVVQVAAELTEEQTLALLDELVDASMVLAGSHARRFRFHDLLGLFARERWEAEDEHEERARTTEVVLEHLVGMACAAGSVFSPGQLTSDVFDSLDEAREWLDQEHANWLAATRKIARAGWHHEALELARSMHWYSDDRLELPEWSEIFGIGVDAARALGDVSAEAQQRNFHGWALGVAGHRDAALEQHQHAWHCAVEAGDQLEQMWALAYAAKYEYFRGDRAEALQHARQAVALSPQFEFWAVRLPVHFRYGTLLLADQQPMEAFAVLNALLAEASSRKRAGESTLARERLMALLLEGTADCLHAAQQCEKAVPMFAEARRIHEEVSGAFTTSRAMMREGRCRADVGDSRAAERLLRQALATFDELSLPEMCADAEEQLARIDPA